jgi:hypothetical protein
VVYVEREDEFESEQSDEASFMDVDDAITEIEPLTSKQKKLACQFVTIPDLAEVRNPANYIQVQAQHDDSFAVLARKNLSLLKDKFNSLLP